MGDNIDYYVGYTIQQTDGTPLGTIDAVDDSTANILFCVVKPNGSDLIIPASDDYIVEIDDEQKIIKMELPEGLLELDD
jgi:16S rRNA processing protein RimM